MDIFVDPEGCVMVRNCGCGKHGLTSFWTEHDKEWQKDHLIKARAIIGQHRARFAKDKERFDRADAVVEKIDA